MQQEEEIEIENEPVCFPTFFRALETSGPRKHHTINQLLLHILFKSTSCQLALLEWWQTTQTISDETLDFSATYSGS